MTTLEKGKWIRLRGRVTIRSRKKNSGGSSWRVNNPEILLGKCKHIPKNVYWWKDIGMNRHYTKGRIECSKCGFVLKFEKNFGVLK